MTLPVWLRSHQQGLHLRIHAQPGARQTRIAGTHGDALKIALQAPPVDGKANQELIRYLARQLGCRKQQIQLVSGEHSREKGVLLLNLAPDAVTRALGEG